MLKKTTLIIVLALMFIVPATSFADMGVGVILGEPTGVSFRMGNFPVIGLGWSFYGRVDASLDMWFLNGDLVEMLDWYLGAGVKVGLKLNASSSAFALGIRVPVGVQWWITEELELFLEAAPGLAILPKFGFDPSGGIGIRYWF